MTHINETVENGRIELECSLCLDRADFPDKGMGRALAGSWKSGHQLVGAGKSGHQRPDDEKPSGEHGEASAILRKAAEAIRDRLKMESLPTEGHWYISADEDSTDVVCHDPELPDVPSIIALDVPFDDEENVSGIAEWLVLMQPAVGEPLAAWLDHVADRLDQMDDTGYGHAIGERTQRGEFVALAVARALLGSQAT